MRKYLIFLLLILFSCQKDEIFEPMPQNNMIFEATTSIVTDGQDISFNVTSTEKHQLVIVDKLGNTITKESFIPTSGLNTRKIYTNILVKGEYTLILRNLTSDISKTNIILE